MYNQLVLVLSLWGYFVFTQSKTTVVPVDSLSLDRAMDNVLRKVFKAIDFAMQQLPALMSSNEFFYVIGVFFLISIPLLLFTLTKKKDKGNKGEQQSSQRNISRKGKTAVGVC
jgi:hypothetical protein